MGGCLAHFGRNWEKASTDPWVIETLSGSRLELQCAPQQKSSPGRIHLDAKKAQALSKEVQARPGHKRSHSISSRQQGGLYLASVLDQSNVPCPKVRRLMATGDKFEVTQQVRGYSPFQDGINQDGKRANPKGGMVSQGRVSRRPHTLFTPKVPEVPVAGPDLAIQGPPVRSVPYTFSTLRKPGIRSILYLDDMLIMAGSKETLSHSNGTTGSSWIYNQHEEEHPLSNTRVGISWLPVEFPQHDNCLADTQTACLEEDGEKDDRPGENDNTGTGFPHRINGSRSPGNPSSSSPLH